MRLAGAVFLSGTLLAGVFAGLLLHVHAAVEHQHGAQDHHQHKSLVHVHIAGDKNLDAGLHVTDRDHGPDETAVIYLSCRSLTPKAPRTMPGMLAVIVGASGDQASSSSLKLARVSHPRAPPNLTGPSLRGPPTA